MTQKKTFAILLFLVFCSSSAHAQWFYQNHGGAFDNEPLHLILTASSDGDGFAIRCKNKHTLEAVFLVTESINDSTIETMNGYAPLLLVKIDDNDVFRFSGRLYDADSQLGVVSSVPEKLIAQLIDAKTKVSVAISVLSEIFYEKEFGVAGSTEKGRTLIDKCKI
jgi:hypothetical protein